MTDVNPTAVDLTPAITEEEEVKVEDVKVDIENKPNKAENEDVIKDAYEQKQSFCQIYVNVFRYYHRIGSMFFQPHR